MKLRQLIRLDWDAIAGIIAAVTAIVLHLLHIVDEETILLIVLALLGLLFINFLRHTKENEITAAQVDQTAHKVAKIQTMLQVPDVVLIGPRRLRSANQQYLRNMSGDTLWFNTCLSMYKTQTLFDMLLLPAINNTAVTSIQFVLNMDQQVLWVETVHPMIAAHDIHLKVQEPNWCHIDNPVSFILADSILTQEPEALLSFWGAPFMASSNDKDIPRYIFHVQQRSELLPHLEELARMQPHNK